MEGGGIYFVYVIWFFVVISDHINLLKIVK